MGGGASLEETVLSLTVTIDELRCNVIPPWGTSGAPQGPGTQRDAVVAQRRETTETTQFGVKITTG